MVENILSGYKTIEMISNIHLMIRGEKPYVMTHLKSEKKRNYQSRIEKE